MSWADAQEITLDEIRVLQPRSQVAFAVRCARILWKFQQQRGLARHYPRGVEELLGQLENLVALDRVFEYHRDDLRGALKPFETSSLPAAWVICAAAHAALSESAKPELIAGFAEKTYAYARQAATDDEIEFHKTARKELIGFIQLDAKKQAGH
jgi:hypothetical protein